MALRYGSPVVFVLGREFIRMRLATPTSLDCAAGSDERPLDFEQLCATVPDALAQHLAAPSLALLSGCCHDTAATFGNAALWLAKLRADWGEEACGAAGHPRWTYAQLDLCERWKLGTEPVAAAVRASPAPTSATKAKALGRNKENLPPTPRTEQQGSRRRTIAASPLDRTQTARLKQDLFCLLTRSCDQRLTAFPETESDLSTWRARVTCPCDGSVHAGASFALRLRYSAPGLPAIEVRAALSCLPHAKDSRFPLPRAQVIEPPCFHPNVDSESGALCEHALQKRCVPAASVSEVLRAVLELLAVPCFSVPPVGTAAAACWFGDEQELHARAQRHRRAL